MYERLLHASMINISNIAITYVISSIAFLASSYTSLIS